MSEGYAILAGEIDNWPSKAQLAELLQSSGFSIEEGQHSILLNDFDHFVFRDLGADICRPNISADHVSATELAAFARRVSVAFAEQGIRHRFEIYDRYEALVDYIHHKWPS